jgi:hypothetical protein
VAQVVLQALSPQR